MARRGPARAILDHRVVEFVYHGYRRTVEPYLLGLHEAGEPLLLGYQIAGPSHSGEIPGWRTFVTTGIGGSIPPTFHAEYLRESVARAEESDRRSSAIHRATGGKCSLRRR